MLWYKSLYIYKNDVVANGSVAETPCQQAVLSDAAVTDVQCT